MALPPKGDPRRPLHLAVRSLRVLGVILVLFSLCTLGPTTLPMLRSGRGGPGNFPVFLVLAVLVYLVPGVLYLVFSIFLARRERWAVIGGLVLASVHGALSLLALVSMALVAATGQVPGPAVIPLVVMALVVVALAQLIYHLARSFEAIRYPPFGVEERGFEPLNVAAGVVHSTVAEDHPPERADRRDAP